MSAVVEIALWVLAVAWWAATAVLVAGVLALRRLPPSPPADDGPPDPSPDPAPRVSLIVAARNEELRIATTARRLLDQRGVEAQVLVVDDRSTDDTSRILDELARTEVRLRVIRVDRLPSGWLGKTHACHLASGRATGEWLLFTDGDVWMRPDTVARAVALARREQVHHVCLIPREGITTLAGQAALGGFFLSFLPAGLLVNRDRWRGLMGVGAFNLVRADAYRSIGGHAPLRLEVIDDAKLGLLLLRHGYRTRALTAFDDIEVHWAPTLGGMVRALEKNAFALARYSAPAAAAIVTAQLGIWAVSLLAPLTGTAAGWAAATGLASLALPCWMLAPGHGWRRPAALLVPLMLPVLPLTLARSAWIATRRGGIRWRGTFYPLAWLRRGLVR